ncbi:hypothetical protein PIB30_053039 [Stylosanthes scabra]|uniref:Uncharacterized protein n=1 Tax=Stylosanthes scabra TaxID=79078 RepID=A0ABU6SJ85_9FABA|nr:hypothetical protein [Stylosanthes scabra]
MQLAFPQISTPDLFAPPVMEVPLPPALSRVYEQQCDAAIDAGLLRAPTLREQQCERWRSFDCSTVASSSNTTVARSSSDRR